MYTCIHVYTCLHVYIYTYIYICYSYLFVKMLTMSKASTAPSAALRSPTYTSRTRDLLGPL